MSIGYLLHPPRALDPRCVPWDPKPFDVYADTVGQAQRQIKGCLAINRLGKFSINDKNVLILGFLVKRTEFII